ncbi:MBL fold metallo-hydrolase, partial [Roseobacter litoralis]
MGEIQFTILGCGSSGGVPRLGGLWGDCDPNNAKNRRRRCSLLVERIGADGKTTVLIDTSPDVREQLLGENIGRLDGVVYTHSHADHVHGIDDLRMIVFNMRARLPVWADIPTKDALMQRFSYVFVQPEGSNYPPILDMNIIDGDVTIDGAGGPVTLSP